MPKTICSIDGCEKLVRARGLCAAHYERERKAGNLSPIPSTKGPCSIEGCDSPSDARRLCKAHYARARRRGDFGVTPCKIEGCTSPSNTRGMCYKHYARAYKAGELEPLPVSSCSFPDCEKPHEGHGWCRGHLQQVNLGYDPYPLTRTALTLEQRFWSYVDKDKSAPCWEWTGTVNWKGYGCFWDGDSLVYSHRWSYEHHIEVIPDGMFIDHLCFNPPCLNPEHLRIVTPKQNCEHRLGPNAGSSTGFRGVHRSERGSGYTANVTHNGRAYQRGPFDTVYEANAVAHSMRSALYTHDDAHLTYPALFGFESLAAARKRNQV